MRKLASVQTITATEPIPNADSIVRARMLGWWVVVKKGEFAAGDRVVRRCRLKTARTPVPSLGEIVLNRTVDELVAMSVGTSVLNPKVQREGDCSPTADRGIRPGHRQPAQLQGD
jgi:predicted ThiF/HesA family dinucleotide-utilizing enzyme